MIEILHGFAGGVIALLLDWAIFTHLSAYMRIGFPGTPYVRYREIALCRGIAITRTVAVAATGLFAGLTFALKLPSLWLIALVLFSLAHAVLYALLYRRRERP